MCDKPNLNGESQMDLAAWTPRALSVLRIMTGLLFLEHGTGKLLGFPSSGRLSNRALVLEAFDTRFNRKDFAAAWVVFS